MVSAWEAINNRRSTLRYRISLRASISVVETGTDESHWPSVLARTREISRDGLTLILPSSELGCPDLRKGEYTFQIVLAITTVANISMTAELIHCDMFEAGPVERAFLLGVKIIGMDTVSRLLYEEFIKTLTWKG